MAQSFIFKLAARNVFRNRRRSAITITAIACGIFSLIVMKGLTDGYGKQAQQNLINLEHGHLQVMSQGFHDDRSAGLGEAMVRPDLVLAALSEMKEVEAATERLTAPSMVNFQGNEMPCLAVGIDLERDRTVFNLAPDLIAGTYLTPGPNAMIGERMARTLGVEVGDYVVWKARALGEGESGPLQALFVEVQGILFTASPAVDGVFLLLPLDFMRESLRAEERATQVVVRIHDPGRLEAVREALAARLEPRGLEVKTWIELATDFLELYRLDSFGNMLIIYILLVIVTVGIANTMVMAAYERIREIGMLMAMGLSRWEVRMLFLVEGMFLGLWGGLIGVAAGAPLTWLLEKRGIPVAWFTGGADVDFGYPIRDAYHAELTPSLILYALAFGVVLAMIASLLPALRASRQDPTQALRHT